jgi:hypothetical protein
MLVFSLLYLPFFCITNSLSHDNLSSTLPTLLHIPCRIGPFTDCILVHEWFYIVFYHPYNFKFILHNLLLCFPKITKIKSLYDCSLLSLHHILFFIYIFIILSLVTTVHVFNLPLHCLSIIPLSIIGKSPLSFIHKLKYLHKSSLITPTIPTIQENSLNHHKLCCLTSWETMATANMKLMKYVLTLEPVAASAITNKTSLPLLLPLHQRHR